MISGSEDGESRAQESPATSESPLISLERRVEEKRVVAQDGEGLSSTAVSRGVEYDSVQLQGDTIKKRCSNHSSYRREGEEDKETRMRNQQTTNSGFSASLLLTIAQPLLYLPKSPTQPPNRISSHLGPSSLHHPRFLLRPRPPLMRNRKSVV